MKPNARPLAILPLAAMLLACAASGRPAPAPSVLSTQASAAPATRDAATACASTNLVWHKASKTNYESYPGPGSEECIKYSGCLYEGQFTACSGKHSLSWVQSHNIVSVFPNFAAMKLHDLCLRSGSGSKMIVATAYDTCADSDCSGCCSKNALPSGNLIDVESFTDARWGVEDGQIEWADLGPTSGGGATEDERRTREGPFGRDCTVASGRSRPRRATSDRASSSSLLSSGRTPTSARRNLVRARATPRSSRRETARSRRSWMRRYCSGLTLSGSRSRPRFAWRRCPCRGSA